MKHNGRAPLRASSVRPNLINLRDGEKRAIVCPDCTTWRPIRDRMVIAHRAEPHSGQPRHRRAEPGRTPRCPGSGQRIWFDITPDQWHEALADAVTEAASRQATTVLPKAFSPATDRTLRARAERTPAGRMADWKAVQVQVGETDAARKQLPDGARPADGPQLPQEPEHLERHDRRQAELGRQYAARKVAATSAA
ncbi:hypothetical protein OHA84_38370 (plasmid) [Streptomyces sp. NBC_00513]|uniref:hypothetical protein n=1 Tax=unclassified Streptomyces TaxID=2593676 RepID=UPI002254E33F|nr:hypothetical protein [Streptomyces sp. NBC_00424]MCX5079211.1 hypothetical protein [Streptomyces sp. NBC_00424]WUD46397.1 hypothetical protein OHA84_38370 [Streptomyces sp. NBC_00513]